MPPQMDGARNGTWSPVIVYELEKFISFRFTNDVSWSANAIQSNWSSWTWWTITKRISTARYVTVDESTWTTNVHDKFTGGKIVLYIILFSLSINFRLGTLHLPRLLMEYVFLLTFQWKELIFNILDSLPNRPCADNANHDVQPPRFVCWTLNVNFTIKIIL